jgi:hypothetical protein
MKNNKIKFSEIKTPKTIDEFRENLRKYYVTNFNGDYLVGKNNEISIDEISSLDDLYELNRDSGIFETPTIIPMVDLPSTGESNNYSIYKNKSEFMNSGKSAWVDIDNQIYREFYVKTLGKFSGYA